MTEQEWMAEGERRFGADRLRWRFTCPACGHVAAVQDWKTLGGTSGMAGFSCVGRLTPSPRRAFEDHGPGPCDYAGGGLIGLNPVVVVQEDGRVTRVFAFADTDGGTA